MKKGITASIVTLLGSIATLILNGLMAFVFLIALDLAIALSGGSSDTSRVTIIIIVLAIAMILSIINIILSISAMVNFKKNRENVDRLKLFLKWFVVSLIFTAIVNIVLAVLTLESLAMWLFIVSMIVYVVCIVLNILQIKALNKNYKSVENE